MTTAPPSSLPDARPSTARDVLVTLTTKNPIPEAGADLRRPPPGVLLSALAVAVLAVAVVAPGVLAPHGATDVDLEHVLDSPSWGHLFGTDLVGRDLLSRVVYGARESLLIGVSAVALATVIAIVFGLAAGLSTRFAGILANRGIEILFAFPTVLLGLLLTSVFGPGRATLVFAVGLGIAPGYARIVRGQVFSVRNAPYIEAARALGHSRTRILLRHIAPNSLRPMIVTVTLGIGQSIIWASGLAYLGLGVAPPAPEWGALLDSGRTYITGAWWLEIFPGLVILASALAFTTLGRHVAAQLEGIQR